MEQAQVLLVQLKDEEQMKRPLALDKEESQGAFLHS